MAKAATSIGVTSPLNVIPIGQNVTFTAVVTPTTPASLILTGQVTFMDGVKVLGKGTLQNGQAIWTTKVPLAAGLHNITAHYLGDSDDLVSGSLVWMLTVG